MELELGLALPDPGPKAAGEFAGVLCLDGKRGFAEAFGARKATTLPLFTRGAGDCGTANKRKRLVGWPPVKCAHRQGGGGGAGYVKVKMEGVAIGRKVDVSRHASYDELHRTLDRMFPPSGGSANNRAADEDVGAAGRRGAYVVTYVDGDGDWLLVGDVPWEAFATSVKRLKILA